MRAVLLATIMALTLGAQPALAAGGSAGSEAALGAGSALTSLVYGPVKVVYAVLGSVFGGFAFVLSGGDSDVAKAVITPAVRGDYVVTPSILRGERDLEFLGRDPAYRPPAASVAEGPSSQSDTYSQGW